jgi:ribosomal protein S18 acetylase RimI-like enzyme
MITYLDSIKGITSHQLRGFFVGWPNPPSPETHLKLLRNSGHILLAFDDETGKVVGFITAISDGILSAYIPFLEVLPEYQRQGIGQELIERMLKKLQGLYMIDLLCDADIQPFYKKCGMKTATGMMIRNHERQSGI